MPTSGRFRAPLPAVAMLRRGTTCFDRGLKCLTCGLFLPSYRKLCNKKICAKKCSLDGREPCCLLSLAIRVHGFPLCHVKNGDTTVWVRRGIAPDGFRWAFTNATLKEGETWLDEERLVWQSWRC